MTRRPSVYVQLALDRAKASQTSPEVAPLCRELQALVRDKDFYLDSPTAGRPVGMAHGTASKFLTEVFPAIGIITVVSKGNWAKGWAARYRYVGSTRPKQPPQHNSTQEERTMPVETWEVTRYR